MQTRAPNLPFLPCLILSLPRFCLWNVLQFFPPITFILPLVFYPMLAKYLGGMNPPACSSRMWLSSSWKCFNYLSYICLSPQPQTLQYRLLPSVRTKAARLGSVFIFGGVCSGRLLQPSSWTHSPCASGLGKQRCLYLGIFLFLHSGTFCVGFSSSHKSRPSYP